MSGLARPVPVGARDAFVQALADIQQTVEHTHDIAKALRAVTEPLHSAAELHTIKLTATRPVSTQAARHLAKSFTVVNPFAFAISLGIGGVSSTNAGAFTVPPKSVATLPITPENLEIGTDPANLAAGDAYLTAFTYEQVQPFFFGEWAG